METPHPQPHKQVKIYVFPHVHKFMLKTFANKVGIFRTGEISTLGKLVSLALLDKQSPANNDVYRDRPLIPITLELTQEQSRHSPRVIKLMRINLDVDVIFKEYLLLWIRWNQSIGKSARAGCLSFLEYYDIDSNEYSLDNAYKVWQRKKDN